MIRTVQTGVGPRPVTAFCFLVGSHMDSALRKAFGPEATILCDDTSTGTETLDQLTRAAERLTGCAPGPIVLVGYSAGCQRVRKLWIDGARPAVVALFDGTHASKPPLKWQMHAYRGMLERAQAGEMMFLASHTFQIYTEGLAKNPYLSTVSVLREVTGLPLPVVREQAVHVDGLVRIVSSPSKLIDRDAHIREQTATMPEQIAEAIVPFVAGWRRSQIDGETTREIVLPWRDARLSYGERMVAWSLAELSAGVREEPPGSNTGARIREYLAGCVRNGKPLGLKWGDWCAAAASFAAREAALDGDYVPPWRASGVEIVVDAGAAGRWVDVEDARAGVYVPSVGDMAIFRRPSPAWGRHVCRVSRWEGPEFDTVGGNEANGWRVTARTMSDPTLLGFVRVA